MSNAAQHKPLPTPGKQDVADYVLQDIQERIEAGEKKYGCKLQTFNGRDALWDAYQGALDLVMYLRQAILERDTPTCNCGPWQGNKEEFGNHHMETCSMYKQYVGD